MYTSTLWSLDADEAIKDTGFLVGVKEVRRRSSFKMDIIEVSVRRLNELISCHSLLDSSKYVCPVNSIH